MPRGIYQRKVHSWRKRYWKNVDVKGPNDCWPWKLKLDKAGYGRMTIDARQILATHCLFRIRTGKWVPKGKQINHKVCHNPPCQNHRHMVLGTHRTNMKDMIRDGTSCKGEKQGRVKLTNLKVRRILRLLARGELTNREIARRFDVSHQAISDIKHGKTWGHVKG